MHAHVSLDGQSNPSQISRGTLAYESSSLSRLDLLLDLSDFFDLSVLSLIWAWHWHFGRGAPELREQNANQELFSTQILLKFVRD